MRVGKSSNTVPDYLGIFVYFHFSDRITSYALTLPHSRLYKESYVKLYFLEKNARRFGLVNCILFPTHWLIWEESPNSVKVTIGYVASQLFHVINIK